MRDINRLDNFYNKLKELHKEYCPDWRFGQLIYNFIVTYGDPFYLEEDDAIAAIEKYLKETFKK